MSTKLFALLAALMVLLLVCVAGVRAQEDEDYGGGVFLSPGCAVQCSSFSTSSTDCCIWFPFPSMLSCLCVVNFDLLSLLLLLFLLLLCMWCVFILDALSDSTLCPLTVYMCPHALMSVCEASMHSCPCVSEKCTRTRICSTLIVGRMGQW